MTTTMTSTYQYVAAGTSYAGTPRWQVLTAAGDAVGWVARMKGKRGDSWSAVGPGRAYSQGGFRSRDAAAKYLEDMVGR